MVSKRVKESGNGSIYKGLSNLKGSRLLKKLEEIDSGLQNAVSVNDFCGFSSLLNEFRDGKLLKTDKKDIKRLLGCCCMEILRLNKGLDLSDECSYDFICLIVSCLHCLENPSPNFDSSRYMKMYNELNESVVLRVLVSVDLDFELSLDLLNVIFSLTSSSASSDVIDRSTRLLLSLFDLYKHIPGELLDVLLMKLIDKECGGVVKDVLVSRKSKFSGDIQHFCMNLLCGSSSEESCYESSGSMYSILVELSSVGSEYVSLLLPLVTQQFKMEDDKARYEAVHCLSQIFSNPSIDYMQQNEGCFSEFCTRFQDRSTDIRVLMCESGKELVRCQPQYLVRVVDLVEERLKDTQWEVRRAAVDSLCNVVNSEFDAISASTVKAVSERVLDKRVEVRKFAVTGLMNIVSIHCSPFWNAGRFVSEEVAKKVGMFPAVFIRCFACCSDDTKNHCSRLLSKTLPSHCDSVDSAGLSYLWFFHELNKTPAILAEDEGGGSVLAFRGLLRDGVKLRGLVRRIVHAGECGHSLESEEVSELLLTLSCALFLNQTSHGTPVASYSASTNCLYCLYRLLSDESKRASVLESLSVLSSECVSLSELSDARESLLQVLREDAEGVKLVSQWKVVCHRLFCSAASRDLVSVYLDLLANESEYSDDCLDLLRVLSEECGEAFLHWSVQVGLFGLFQRYLGRVSDGVRMSKKEKRRWSAFLEVLGNQSGGYATRGDVLLNESGEWNDGYTSELLPLLDESLSLLYAIPVESVSHVLVVVSNFCRFIRSGDVDLDQSIRIRYNEWLNGYLPSLSLKKESARVLTDLHCVCKLLELDRSNCSHLGIRCLVDAVLETADLEEAVHQMGLSVLSAYAVAMDQDCESCDRVLTHLLETSLCPSDEVSARALVCLLRVGGLRSYAGFFTAERFYALGVRVEKMKEERVVENLVVRISELIREYQLPLKYLCYIMVCWLRNKTGIQDAVKRELRLIISNQRKYLLYYKSRGCATSSTHPPLYQLSPEYCLVYLLPLLSRLQGYKDLSKTPSKLQIRCLDIYLSSLVVESSGSLGLLNAILVSMQKSDDGLLVGNAILSRLLVLCNQLVHKHIQTLKTVDVSYSESIRLPGQYYVKKSLKRGGSDIVENKRSKL